MKLFPDVLKPILKIAKENLPTVAITAGVLLDGAAVIFGIKETPHAREILEEKKPETVMEKAGVIIPCYWKTILSFIFGTGLIMVGNKMHLERTAVLLGIAASQKEKLAAVAEETKKLVGPKKAEEIESAAEMDRVDMDKVASQNPVVVDGDQLFVCSWNNYAFRSTIEKVKELDADILRELMACKTIDLADVECIIGTPSHNGDYHKGWNEEHPPRLKIAGWKDGPDGRPMGVLTITPEPMPDWTLDAESLF